MGLAEEAHHGGAAAAARKRKPDEGDANALALPRKRSSLDMGDRPSLPGPWGLQLKPRHWSCAEELNLALAAAAAAGALDPVQVRGVQHICKVPSGRGLIAGRLAAIAPTHPPRLPPAGPAGPAAGHAGDDDWRLRPRTPPPPDPDAAAHAALAAALLAAGPLAGYPEHGASVYRVATPPCLAAWARRWFGAWSGGGGGGRGGRGGGAGGGGGGDNDGGAAPPSSLRVVALHGWGAGAGGDAPALCGGLAPPRGLGGAAGAPRDTPARTVWVPFFQQQQQQQAL